MKDLHHVVVMASLTQRERDNFDGYYAGKPFSPYLLEGTRDKIAAATIVCPFYRFLDVSKEESISPPEGC